MLGRWSHNKTPRTCDQHAGARATKEEKTMADPNSTTPNAECKHAS
jgi:hypothetical protein